MARICLTEKRTMRATAETTSESYLRRPRNDEVIAIMTTDDASAQSAKPVTTSSGLQMTDTKSAPRIAEAGPDRGGAVHRLSQ